MNPKVYQYAKCSTCQKALALLSELKVEYQGVDIVESPPSKQELKEVLRRTGLPLRKLFNTSGKSYREGNFGDKLSQLSEAEALTALAEDGKLVKRPLVLGHDYALVGFDEKAYRERFAR